MIDSLRNLIMNNLFHCEKCQPRPVFLTLMDFQRHHFERHERPLLDKRDYTKCNNFNEKHLIQSHLNYSNKSQANVGENCKVWCMKCFPKWHECRLDYKHQGQHKFQCDTTLTPKEPSNGGYY